MRWKIILTLALVAGGFAHAEKVEYRFRLSRVDGKPIGQFKEVGRIVPAESMVDAMDVVCVFHENVKAEAREKAEARKELADEE